MADGAFTGILESSLDALTSWLRGPSFNAHFHGFFPSFAPAKKVRCRCEALRRHKFPSMTLDEVAVKAWLQLQERCLLNSCFMNWLRIRRAWLYILHVPGPDVLNFEPHKWRILLNGLPPTPNLSTKTGRRVQEVKEFFRSHFSLEDINFSTVEPVLWFDHCLTDVPSHLAPLILWEMFELGFRCELIAMDKLLRRTCTLNEEVQREEFLSQIFPGQDIYSVTSLPTVGSAGLFSPISRRRIGALNALRALLLYWPWCPPSVQNTAPLRTDQRDEDIEAMEFTLASFYVNSFFTHSGRAPLVPHLLPPHPSPYIVS